MRLLTHFITALQYYFDKPRISSYSDRRQFPRIENYNLLKRIKSYTDKYALLSNMLNLSASGLQCLTRDYCRVGELVQLALNIAEESIQIRVLGKVVWSIPPEEGSSHYRTGIHFDAINPEDRNFLIQYVERLSRITLTEQFAAA